MAQSTITVDVKGIEITVDVYGEVTTGGSNSYPSTDPEWIDVDGIEVWHPDRTRPVINALADHIIYEHEQKIIDALIE